MGSSWTPGVLRKEEKGVAWHRKNASARRREKKRGGGEEHKGGEALASPAFVKAIGLVRNDQQSSKQAKLLGSPPFYERNPFFHLNPRIKLKSR